jgi:hypothetical protein
VITFRFADPAVGSRPGAALFEEVSLAPLRPDADALLADPNAKRQLVSGWSTPERYDARVGIWSEGDRSEVELLLDPRGGPYAVGLVARAHPGVEGGTSTVEVEVNQTGVGSVKVGPEWDTHYVPVELDQLKRGSNRVRLRYPATVQVDGPTPDSKAHRAVLVERLVLRPARSTVRIDIGHPDDRHQLVRGFTPDPPWGADKRFVFSEGKVSRVRFPLRPSDGAYVLEVGGFGFPPIAPVGVQVKVNGGAPVASIELGEEERTHSVELPPGKLVPGTNTIELEYAKTGQPKQFDDTSQDGRELAAGLSVLHLRPAQ